ncbi:hypothetical protein [Paludibacterium sp. B53371]|uniref:hypothetical protein n=1 Tax=Paludibacterium sp. B53371 TaxID=2806263 RepID=UPI001C058FC1|nr:hypothetical protein [Paludibacterium sp. B53371]
MTRWKVTLWHHQILWGVFETEVPQAEQVITQLLQLLSPAQGFQAEVRCAEQESRLIETGPTGTRLLAITPHFRQVDWPVPA